MRRSRSRKVENENVVSISPSPLLPFSPSASETESLLEESSRQLQEAGIEQSRFEAQLLLAYVLNVPRIKVVAGLHPPPDAAQREQFKALVQARARHAPSAYLRGVQEFFGMPFRVGPAVLIPRPETELLVEEAIQHLLRQLKKHAEPVFFADVGTGSGCIAISVLAYVHPAHAVAFDLCAAALALARQNAVTNDVADRLHLAQADLLSATARERFDLIVSNPPYIPTADLPKLQPEVRDFEPRLALDGGPDGLSAHSRLVEEAMRALKPGGWLSVEVAMGQATAVSRLFRENGLVKLRIRRDLAGIERVVSGQKQP